VDFVQNNPIHVGRDTIVGRTALEGRTIHIPDVLQDPEYRWTESQQRGRFRTLLGVPMLREGHPIGVIAIWREEVRPFSDKQIELVTTFADQAVIAVENVRLFNETKQALEQQTATSEILRVIASSPTDIQPVLDALAESANRLCRSVDSSIFLLDGGRLVLGARHGPSREVVGEFTLPIVRGTVGGRTVLERRTIHVLDLPAEADEFPEAAQNARIFGFRTMLSVPLIREDAARGVIQLRRSEVNPFTERQAELLKTFADQAVIAIENVRLFTELEARNHDLTRALDRETATSEILRVISSSPTDVQPVFDAIVRSASTLCHAPDAIISMAEGDVLRFTASVGTVAAAVWQSEIVQDGRLPLTRGSVSGRAFIDQCTVHVHDVRAVSDNEFPEGRALQRAYGGRGTTLAVPLLRGSVSLGVITLIKDEVSPFTDQQIALLKTFADQAAIAIENVRLFNETKEALERQTATAEILRIIANSPTDVQPILEAAVQNAARLCATSNVSLYQVEGSRMRKVAEHGSPLTALSVGETRPISRKSVSGRAILDATTIHLADHQSADAVREYPDARRDTGIRTTIGVPLLREGIAIGVFTAYRTESRPFAEREIALLKTFADQAAIAIENVRLFNETKEALEQQIATSEILRVISSSRTEVQPVFDAIAQSARRLFEANYCAVARYDGNVLHLAAHAQIDAEGVEAMERFLDGRPGRQLVLGRAVLDNAVVHIADVLMDTEYDQSVARAVQFRSILGVPMRLGGSPIGAITVSRAAAGPFAAREIALLQTFADQAVIAIENVRLFTELEARNRDLTTALDQQTATSDILKVISSSPTDVQPVFDAIVDAAARLCHAIQSNVQLYDGQLMHYVAANNVGPAAMEVIQRVYPMPPNRNQTASRAILDNAVAHVPDVLEDAEYLRELAVQAGSRSMLSVPMVAKGRPIGAITVARMEPGLFSDAEVELLKTFADQAVIAIENVRLFTELHEKNEALTEAHATVTESLERQTATAEILSVISRSATDLQPVFDTIMRSAVQLCGAHYGSVCRFDGELVHVEAQHSGHDDDREVIRQWASTFPRRLGESGAWYGVITSGRVVHLHDVGPDEPSFTQAARDMTRALQIRSALFVPIARENQIIGAIGLLHREREAFTAAHAELLQTFADQAVIAIENVRLFKELEARTQDLTRSVDELTALGEVGRAVSSTLDLETVLSTIVSRAIQLSGTDGGSVYEYDEATEEFSLRVSRDLPEAYVEQVRDARPRKGEGAVGRVAQTREPVQIADISDPAAYESRVRNMLLQIGLRALLAVPLIAEDRLVGALIVMRKRTGTFAAEEVALLQTFATQSALAIQNARLFREIEEKSRQLEAASQHKSEFLANMSHELRTPLNAIIGFSEVLTDRMFGELNEKQEEYLKDIYASGTHLLSLINDILDLSKIEAGRMELELADFDLPTAIENALMLVRERAGRRSIALHTSIDNQLGQIHADERKVRQVVLNLLSNAIKFTPEGGRIDVGAVATGRFVEVSVTDTGIGIAPEDQEKVFEEFRQVGTAAKKVEGTGLGLTLCRKFVELHGGRIWVTSQLGQGSTFTFTIPVRPA
jgi:GAF domain-containing protein